MTGLEWVGVIIACIIVLVLFGFIAEIDFIDLLFEIFRG